MIKSTNPIRRFLQDTRGANLVEYIILVGVVALISIAAFKTFGGKVQETIGKQGTTVGNINSGSGELSLSTKLPLEGLVLINKARPGRRGPILREASTEGS